MSKIDVIRAWKDEDYRSRLSDAERSELPDNPAGLVELSETELSGAAGGTILTFLTLIICPTVHPAYCSEVTVCPSINYCPLPEVPGES